MAQVKEVEVPDIGDFTDVPVIEVLVAVGDTIAAEDAMVTLETDKATMDVPAPFAGTVAELRLKEGDLASQGTVVLTLTVDAEASDDAAPSGDGSGSAQADDAPAQADTEPARDADPKPAETGSAKPAPTPTPAPAAAPSAAGIYASPSIRRAARERGIDLAGVEGTGRKGRIVAEDLDRPAAAAQGAPAGGATQGVGGLELIPWPKVDFEKFGPVERVPLRRIQKLSAANLARNWVHIPHVTHHDDADVTDLEAFRKQLNAEQAETKVTMVALLLKAAAATLKAFPDVNASLDGEDLVRKGYYHLGFAADTPNGLVVPVVRDVDQKGLLELAGEIGELAGKARAGKLGPAEMSGGTFTVSSLGGIGGTSFTPIVNAPEVAILGVVRSVIKPVWDGQAFAPRLMLPLSLSYDHRVIDGASAARFVAHLASVLADLRRVLL